MVGASRTVGYTALERVGYGRLWCPNSPLARSVSGRTPRLPQGPFSFSASVMGAEMSLSVAGAGPLLGQQPERQRGCERLERGRRGRYPGQSGRARVTLWSLVPVKRYWLQRGMHETGKGMLCPFRSTSPAEDTMPRLKTRIPQDFSVDETDREYCERKWGSPRLADVFLSDFLEVFEENDRRHKDWHRTFKTFIRRASPSGDFHKPRQWEQKLSEAKPHRQRIHRYDPREHSAPPATRSVPALAQSMLAKLRGQLS